MKVWHLGQGPAGACVLLQHRGLRILVDPCADLSPFLHTAPQPPAHTTDTPLLLHTKSGGKAHSLHPHTLQQAPLRVRGLEGCGVDVGEVDVVLLSHWQAVLALPYVTEYGRFRGKVYATVPTAVLGGQMMDELLLLAMRGSVAQPQHGVAGEDGVVSGLYTLSDARSSLARITQVSYNEVLMLAGVIRATATSSGLALGSCNWVLESPKTKVFYMAGSCVSRVPRHPLPFDPEPLAHCDTVLLAGLNPVGAPPYQAMLDEICRDVATTINLGGSVLVPVHPVGTIYDLLEAMHNHLQAIGRQAVPFYWLAPMARPSLVLANVFAEWLHGSKADRVYLPECPFVHEDLLRCGRLHLAACLQDLVQSKGLREPCVVFAGHPSLRCGDAVQLLQQWRTQASHLLLLTEPDTDMGLALAPYQPMPMRVRHCPLDPRATVQDACQLMKTHRPRLVACPSACMWPRPAAKGARGGGEGLEVEAGTRVVEMVEGAAVSMRTPQGYEQALLHDKLGGQLQAVWGGRQGQVAAVQGLLDCHNHRLLLQSTVPEEEALGQLRWFQQQHVLGVPSVGALVAELRAKLHGDVVVEVDGTAPNKLTLRLPLARACVVLGPGSSHVTVEEDDGLLRTITDLLLRHLQRI